MYTTVTALHLLANCSFTQFGYMGCMPGIITHYLGKEFKCDYTAISDHVSVNLQILYFCPFCPLSSKPNHNENIQHFIFSYTN